MERHLKLVVFVVLIYLVAGSEIRRKKQVGTGVTFAFPGLSLLGLGNQNYNQNQNQGNNNNFNNNNNNGGIGGIGGNIFGQATFTRTLVSTVSTVTTASFRTCTTTMAGALPCAGRRRRDVHNAEIQIGGENLNENNIFNDDETANIRIEPTASVVLIIGATTLSNPLAVSEYLVAHQPSSQSIIYPHDVVISEIEELQASSGVQETTALYPSHDSPEQSTIHFDDIVDETTEPPLVLSDAVDDLESEIAETTPNIAEEDLEKARVGLGKTTTVTTVIRVTSVATTLASGTSATLTVMYMGCLPQSLPVSGIPC